MILANILIVENDAESSSLPEAVQENIQSFRDCHPGMDHTLFTGPAIREVIRGSFGRDVLRAYDALKPFSYKSDLARYCLMHQFGGVYADLSMYFVQPWLPTGGADPAGDGLAVFQDFKMSAPWDTISGMFAATAGHRALAKAIDMICHNVSTGYYGNSTLCPTGPTMWGRAIATTCGAEDIRCGESHWVDMSPVKLRHPIEGVRHALVFRKKVICVKRRPLGKPFAELGISGGNSYISMWKSRDIYQQA